VKLKRGQHTAAAAAGKSRSRQGRRFRRRAPAENFPPPTCPAGRSSRGIAIVTTRARFLNRNLAARAALSP